MGFAPLLNPVSDHTRVPTLLITCFLFFFFSSGSYFQFTQSRWFIVFGVHGFLGWFISDTIPWCFRSGRAECWVRELLAIILFDAFIWVIRMWSRAHGPATYIAYISFLCVASILFFLFSSQIGPCLGNSHLIDVVEFMAFLISFVGGSAGLLGHFLIFLLICLSFFI